MMMTSNPELQAKLNQALPLNSRTADFACFWTAACQAQTNPRLVPQTLERYGREFGRGEMNAAVPELWATALLNSGKPKEAIALLDSIPQTVRTVRMAFLLQRWKASTESKPETSAAPETKPASPTETPPAPATAPATPSVQPVDSGDKSLAPPQAP
jgi:hypothetical protein